MSGLTGQAPPRFPRLLSLPLAAIPASVHGAMLVGVLNRVLAASLAEGELDFLRGRTVCINISDMQITLYLTLSGNELAAAGPTRMPELSITGTLHACLLLAARREDADALFFRRRLSMEGDTELGLAIRNFLDGLDVDTLWLPRHASRLARLVLPLYERLAG